MGVKIITMFVSAYTGLQTWKHMHLKANVNKDNINICLNSQRIFFLFPFSISQGSKKKTQGFSKKNGVLFKANL